MIQLDENGRAQRRNVIIVSVALTVFYLGGGRVEGFSAAPLGLVRFEFPGVILIAAWFTWLYSIWRFWQISGDVRDNVFRCMDAFLRGHLAKSESPFVINKLKTIPPTELAPGDVERLANKAYPYLTREDGVFKLIWWQTEPKEQVRRDRTEYFAGTAISTRDAWRIIRKTLYTALIEDNRLADAAVPYAIAMLAPISSIIRFTSLVLT